MTALILPFHGVWPRIHESAFIAPNATLIGDVEVGENSSVFYGAVLRGDRAAIRIGRGSNIQDNVSVHCDPGTPMLLGENVSVGHSAMLHGCVIGDGSLIGMSATILNRAVVGAGTLIAAGAVILEDTDIATGSLVAGVPGKVRRALDDEEKAGLLRNAEVYRGLRAEHLDMLAGLSTEETR